MSIITRQDTNGVKPLLQVGELGYDNFPTGGDAGRVYVGTGAENIAQAKRSEVTAVDSKVDTHVARVNNPHGVTKAQVGLGNVDNTSDATKNVLSATRLTTPRTINGVLFDGTSNINIETGTIDPDYVVLTTGDQEIYNTKTFRASPIVPTPTTGTQAVNKDYADLKLALESFTGMNQMVSSSGYQKLPGGLIIQWGYGSRSIFYPIAFPNDTLAVVVTSKGGGTYSGVNYWSSYHVDVFIDGMEASFIAIGY